LKDGGRMILALTKEDTVGAWFRIERQGDEFLAKWFSVAGLFSCGAENDHYPTEESRRLQTHSRAVTGDSSGRWGRVGKNEKPPAGSASDFRNLGKPTSALH